MQHMGVAWHLQILCSRSLQSVLYNMHHEGSSPGPGRAGEEPLWHLSYIAKVLGNSHAAHGSGLALINCIVADHSQL